MRKEYVKPIMESEEFVVNEYVAACTNYTQWTLNCLGTSAYGHCPWHGTGSPTNTSTNTTLLAFLNANAVSSSNSSYEQITESTINGTLYHSHDNKGYTEVNYTTTDVVNAS